MVAQLWADGIVQGIRHNRPEVVGVEVDVQRLEQEFAPREVRALEDDAQESSWYTEEPGRRKELGSGETSD